MQGLADKVATGQPSPSNAAALTEKKNYYQGVFDEMSGGITTVKKYLKEMKRAMPRNNRIVLLLERYEKCEQEIGKIREVVRNFSPLSGRSGVACAPGFQAS
jgi:hypothetical protein